MTFHITEVDFTDFANIYWRTFQDLLEDFGENDTRVSLFTLAEYYSHKPCVLQGSYENLKQVPLLVLQEGETTLPVMVIPDYYSGKQCLTVPNEDVVLSVHQRSNEFMEKFTKSGLPIRAPLGDSINFAMAFKGCYPSFPSYIEVAMGKGAYGADRLFFKTKAKDITWEMLSGEKAYGVFLRSGLDILLRKNHTFIQRNLETSNRRFPLPSIEAVGWPIHASLFRSIMGTNRFHVMTGYDTKKQTLIGMCLGFEHSGGVTFTTVATEGAEEYKRYSLVLAAHLAIMRDFIEGKFNWDFVDFSVNFDPVADYKEKMAISHIPFMGSPVFDSLEQILSYGEQA